MSSAFLLVQAASGQAGTVVAAIGAMPDVEMVEAITGPYDAVARVRGAQDEAERVRREVAELNDVVRTLTCLVGATTAPEA